MFTAASAPDLFGCCTYIVARLLTCAASRLGTDCPRRGQGTVAEMSDGSVMMVFRTQLAAAAVSKSWDDGETWSAPMLLTVRGGPG